MFIAVNERIVELERAIPRSQNAVGAPKDFDSMYGDRGPSERNSVLTLRDQCISNDHSHRDRAVELNSPVRIADLNVFNKRVSVRRFNDNPEPSPDCRLLATENGAICVLAGDKLELTTDDNFDGAGSIADRWDVEIEAGDDLCARFDVQVRPLRNDDVAREQIGASLNRPCLVRHEAARDGRRATCHSCDECAIKQSVKPLS